MGFPFLLLLSVCFGIFTQISGQLDFDCRRQGITCGDGVCDLGTGKCNCSSVAGETDYRCRGSDANKCTESTYGDDCDLSRVQVDCTGNKMFVNINPHATFQGVIYVMNKGSDAACQLKDLKGALPDYVTNKEKVKGLSLELGYEGSACGDATKTVKDIDGRETTTYVRDYFVQYDSNFKTALDQKIAVTCVITAGLAKVTGQVKEILEGDSNFKEIDVDADADLDVVTFTIKDKNNADLSSQVNLGDEINLIFTMKPNSGFVDFSLESCIANNTLSTDEPTADSKSITFLEDDCPSSVGQALFRNGVSKEQGATANDTSTITVSISAFMFSGASSKVGFLCNVKLCGEANKDDCKKTDCNGTTSEADKKRQEQEKEAAAATTTTSTPEVTKTTDNATTGITEDASNSTDTTDNGQNNDNTLNATTTPAAGNNETTVANDNATTEAVEANATTTAPSNVAARRRRRAAAEEDEPVKQVYKEMSVRDPSVPLKESETLVRDDKDCLQETEIITVIAILSVLVVILFTLTLAILSQMIRSGAKKQTSSSDRADVTPIQTFNIPRLEINAKRNSSSHATA